MSLWHMINPLIQQSQCLILYMTNYQSVDNSVLYSLALPRCSKICT